MMTATHDDPCDCQDFSLTRRSLLRGAAALGTSVTVHGWAGLDTSRAEAVGVHDSVVVVMSLRGGADGLSLVVPHGDPAYVAARPRIAVPAEQLLGADAMFGLHPGFAPLLPLWRVGSLAAVHAVGLPIPNRSHFRAMELIEDADPGSPERRGWINRLIGGLDGSDPVEGVQLGVGSVSTSLFGQEPTLALSSLSSLELPGQDTALEVPTRSSLTQTWSVEDGPLGRGARAALDVTSRLSSLADPPAAQPPKPYPRGELGSALGECARLIRAQVGASVISVEHGSWDMHTSIGQPTQGKMRSMVDELAGAIDAFFADIGEYADSVTLVTISEFGRRVVENGNTGLDHGYGNCMLVMGSGVRGGRVHTRWPGLDSRQLVDDDLAVTVDYRSVLTEVVRARFPAVAPATVFPGFVAEQVGVML